jgi:hypothetical protein
MYFVVFTTPIDCSQPISIPFNKVDIWPFMLLGGYFILSINDNDMNNKYDSTNKKRKLISLSVKSFFGASLAKKNENLHE